MDEREWQFTNEALGCRFNLPRPFTIRHLEAWEDAKQQALESGSKTLLSLRWVGALALITDWECEALPDRYSTEIADEQLRVIAWVGRIVQQHIANLVTVPGN